VIRSVPATTAEDVPAMVERGRAAQPGWEAMGFDGRGRVLRRMQKWLIDNSDRVVRTLVEETGKTWEDAAFAEIM
jgi:acyl-CoA reductase-like NAD-dependent aldehyde dehydrogenase